MQNYRNLWCSSELILSLPPGLNTETLRCYFSALFHSSGFSKSLVCTTNVWPAALDFTFISNFSVVTELQTISELLCKSFHYFSLTPYTTLMSSVHLNPLYSRKYTTVNLFYIIFTPCFLGTAEKRMHLQNVSLVHACMRKQRSLISEPS